MGKCIEYATSGLSTCEVILALAESESEAPVDDTGTGTNVRGPDDSTS